VHHNYSTTILLP